MSRSRTAFSVALLALALLTGLTDAACAASRAWTDSSFEQPATASGSLVRAAADWSQGALTWMQSIFGAEHGAIVPIVPETPPDPCTLPDPPASCSQEPDPSLTPEP